MPTRIPIGHTMTVKQMFLMVWPLDQNQGPSQPRGHSPWLMRGSGPNHLAMLSSPRMISVVGPVNKSPRSLGEACNVIEYGYKLWRMQLQILPIKPTRLQWPTQIPDPCFLGAIYTMDHEVVPRPSKRCDWTLKSSRDDLGLHQGKNGRGTTEVEVLKI
jgi:hypothetical protein